MSRAITVGLAAVCMIGAVRAQAQEPGPGAPPDAAPAIAPAEGAEESPSDAPPAPAEGAAERLPARVIAIEGTLVSIAHRGAEARVDVGCPGTSPIVAGSSVYLLCPPRRVVRVGLPDDGEPYAVAITAAVDLVELRSVDGVVHARDRRGVVRPLIEWQAQPSQSLTQPLFPSVPDPRLDAILERARSLAERGESVAALGVVERAAAQPACPPLVWDGDIARAAVRGVASLPTPHDQGFWLWAGIPVTVLGGAGVITGLMGALVAALASSLGGDTEALAVFGSVGLGSIVVVVIGGLMIAASTNAFSPRARQFDRRRHRLLELMRPRGMGPTDVYVAFEHRDCRE